MEEMRRETGGDALALHSINMRLQIGLKKGGTPWEYLDPILGIKTGVHSLYNCIAVGVIQIAESVSFCGQSSI